MAETETIPAIDPQPAAEQPQYPKGYFTRITPANAREMAAKAVLARAQAQTPANLVALPAAQPANDRLDPYLERRVHVTREMIEQTEKDYKACDTAKEKQSLATALDKLYQTWSLLTGHEKPGVRKSSTKTRTKPTYSNLPEPDPE